MWTPARIRMTRTVWRPATGHWAPTVQEEGHGPGHGAAQLHHDRHVLQKTTFPQLAPTFEDVVQIVEMPENKNYIVVDTCFLAHRNMGEGMLTRRMQRMAAVAGCWRP